MIDEKQVVIMKASKVHLFNLPERIARLEDLAGNLWFSWNPDALALLRSLDAKLWEDFDHNPVRVLRDLDPQRLVDLAADKAFLSQYDAVIAAFDAYMGDTAPWFTRTHAEAKDKTLAYFSMEFGFHECIRIYSGGLGILAGDHLKTASDMGLPMVGVGLLYRVAYFTQFITRHGDQQAVYRSVDYSNMAMQLVKDADGDTLTVRLPVGDRMVAARVWQVKVGRIPLYLLDTDFPQNTVEDRRITERLYVGDRDLRLIQEMILGIGGVMLLEALNINPAVWHMNEGHSGLLTLERIRSLMGRGQAYEAAFEQVRKSNIFTTHTPVPAGNETFEVQRLDRLMSTYLKEMGLDRSRFLKLGHTEQQQESDPYNLTVLALKTSHLANGVSQLHGDVAREMWQSLWPERAVKDVPIGAITNGVHLDTWMTTQVQHMLTTHLSADWKQHVNDAEFWKGLQRVSPEALWNTHRTLKKAFIKEMRRRIAKQRERNGESHESICEAWTLFDPEVLTIGFARRFAPYKRATLMFKDMDRFRAILNNTDRPVQIVIAGKAHPADVNGQGLIRSIYEISRQPEFANRLTLIENYDMILSRRMVSGVDVWLNTPRRPLEASGTSGMKVALNGGLNMSILDGWWCEGYDPAFGWAIGEEKNYTDNAQQDWEDAQSFYHLLETEVIPAYYQRDASGLPLAWIQRMKDSMAALIPQFNTNRMLEEYIDQMYLP